MIFVKLISGLGNQLFQYAIGRQLSIKRQVPLMLDTSFFQEQQLRSFKLGHYNINATEASQSEVFRFFEGYHSNSLGALIRRKMEALLPKNQRRYYKEDEWWIYEPGLLSASSNVYLDGYWQHYKYYENIDPEIIRELTVTESYPESIKKLLGEIQQNGDSISIHVRRGDYVTDPTARNFMGLLPLEYYHRAAELIMKKLKAPVFYIFSDDLDWVKSNLKLNASMVFVDHLEEKKDYVELDIMSKCCHNIIANSSFSWWAAFLNLNPHKIVIAPSNWVAEPETNKRVEIQFPSWIKL